MVEIYSIEARHHVEDNESDGIHHGHSSHLRSKSERHMPAVGSREAYGRDIG
jgi:hypothetical protein